MLGLAMTGCGPSAAPPAAGPASAAAPTSAAAAPAAVRSQPTPPPVRLRGGQADPVSLSIPAAGVRTPLVRLGLARDGSLSVPTDFGKAGWFVGGPRPGEAGPAVIAGHVDSRRGPAVFYRLRALRAGDRILVQRRDGSSVTFAVTKLRQYAKNAFPTRDVYGAVPFPELRLITCAGEFDRKASSYRANLVVFASLPPQAARPPIASPAVG